uniref:Uncharacterized protein n=1 Tax=Timema bartmani TaxID=61472 RepID=A0A7R9HYW6_9NEOP|nr:unnamed protein product [Timema bartmani]
MTAVKWAGGRTNQLASQKCRCWLYPLFQVRVMLRVNGDPAGGDSNTFFSVDPRKKQVTLVEPAAGGVGDLSAPEDRRVGVAAPKMFAFDAIFNQDDCQILSCLTTRTPVKPWSRSSPPSPCSSGLSTVPPITRICSVPPPLKISSLEPAIKNSSSRSVSPYVDKDLNRLTRGTGIILENEPLFQLGSVETDEIVSRCWERDLRLGATGSVLQCLLLTSFTLLSTELTGSSSVSDMPGLVSLGRNSFDKVPGGLTRIGGRVV